MTPSLVDKVHRRVLVMQPDGRGETTNIENHLDVGGVHLVENPIKPREVESIFCRLKRVPGQIAHADEGENRPAS
jgi:hypothetical protein